MKTVTLTRKLRALVLAVFTTAPFIVSAQYCDSITPSFIVDLSAAPYMTWVSPDTDRDGFCCGATAPDKCLEFIITLHPNSAAVVFNIASGAVPPGALFYQIDCGPPVAVGSPICLNGTGPFHLTFCKPGNNTNTFSIETIPNPIFGPNLVLGDGCSDDLWVQFYDESTITWNSISPGAPGSQNGLLSCVTACDTVTATNNPLAPPIVEYLVCGMASNGCTTDPICDTMSVQFVPEMNVTINAPDTVLCPNETTVPAQALVTGGTVPYTFSWSNGATTASTNLGPGTHTVSVTDANACVVRQATVTVTQLLPPSVSAGGDQDLCADYIGVVSLTATAANTAGIQWTGGGGIFLPDDTSLVVGYIPSLFEILTGSINIGVETVNNNGCPEATDNAMIDYNSVAESVFVQTQDVSCNGMTNGTALVGVVGMNGPYTVSFDGGAYNSTFSQNNLAPGTHTVSVMSGLGCDTLITFTIGEPPLLTVAEVNNTDVLCAGGSTGSTTVASAGGFGTHSYSWNTAPVQTQPTASNLATGTYTVTVTDANGCTATLDVNINEPAPLANTFNTVPPSCFGLSNGAISSNVTGGTAPYLLSWSTGASATNIYDVAAGTYTLQITDDNGCVLVVQELVTQPPLLESTMTNDTTICPGSPVTLTVNATGGTGNYTYNWSPAGPNAAQQNVNPLSTQLYTCTVSDNNGCTSQSSVTLTTISLDPDDITATVSDSIICYGETVQLGGAYTGPDTTVTLAWNHCASCPVITDATPLSDSTFTLVATNQCNQQIMASVTVQVVLPPLVQLDPNLGEYCPNEYFSVSNNGDNNEDWFYTWNFGDGTVSHDMNGIHSYSEPGNYEITLTIVNEYGCESDAAAAGYVTVHPQANAEFISSSLVETTLDPTFTFTNLSTDATTYEWSFGDGNGSAIFSPTHTYETYGVFTVTLNANNQYNCPDQEQLVIEVKPSFNVYIPNAFTPDGDNHNGVFLVEGFGIQEKDFSFVIYDRWGEVIFESSDRSIGWDGTYKSHPAQDGVYTWVVRFRDLTDTKHELNGHVSLLR